MRVLLDTHTWLWWITVPEQLGAQAHRLLKQPANTVYFSIASTWEIAIKYSMGKLPLPSPPETLLPIELQRDGFTTLQIEHRHALAVSSLPLLHRDLFDRLLVAQAQCEAMPILTRDANIARYDVETIWE